MSIQTTGGPHPENEHKVIHVITDIVIPPEGISVKKKLVNIISGALKSPIGEFPLTEFYYRITEDAIDIYDRHTAFLISVGIGNFTPEEVYWIITNLPLFQDNAGQQDESMLKLEFLPWQGREWMVFRRSGSNNQLIGYIRENCPHIFDDDPEPEPTLFTIYDGGATTTFEGYLVDLDGGYPFNPDLGKEADGGDSTLYGFKI